MNPRKPFLSFIYCSNIVDYCTKCLCMYFIARLASRISVSCGRPLVKPKGHIHHHLKEHKYHLQYLLLSLSFFSFIFLHTKKLSSKINHLYDHVKYNNNSPNEPVQSLSFCCRMMPTASLHKKFQFKIGRGWLNYFIMIFLRGWINKLQYFISL